MNIDYSKSAKRDPDSSIQFPSDKGHNGLNLGIWLG